MQQFCCDLDTLVISPYKMLFSLGFDKDGNKGSSVRGDMTCFIAIALAIVFCGKSCEVYVYMYILM